MANRLLSLACLGVVLAAQTRAQKSQVAPSGAPQPVSLAEYSDDRALFPYYLENVLPGTYWGRGADQGLAFRLTASEVAVVPIDTDPLGTPAWQVILRCTGFGRTGEMEAPAAPAMSVAKNRADLAHGNGLACSFVNEKRGLEQGWTIASPPAGDLAKPVAIELELDGDLAFVLDPDRSGGRFVDAQAVTHVWYRALRVLDRRGKNLEAWIETTVAGVRLCIDDHSAKYPLTVDPILSGPMWTAEGNQAGAGLGTSVASAGDVNGDGFDDVLVGAPSFDGAFADEGAAYLYLGSAGGTPATPAWTVLGGSAGAGLGTSVAGAGDLNGDGYADVLVGAPGKTAGAPIAGSAMLYLGSAGGLSATPAWTVGGTLYCEMVGAAVAFAGDVNGDGFDDVLVGAGGENGVVALGGKASLYLGSAGGVSSTPAWSQLGTQVVEHLGLALAGAGDVDGDGFDDVILGSPFHDTTQGADAGQAYLYLGSATGLSASPNWTYSGDLGNELGFAVAGAGDVNGDGFANLLVGAPRRTVRIYAGKRSVAGEVEAFLGGAGGPASVPDWSAGGDRLGALFGAAVGAAGDLDADGFADILVGSPFDSSSSSALGVSRAYAFRGGPNGLEDDAAWADSGSASFAFGTAVAGAGDVNGDGFADALVGAPRWSAGEMGEGLVFLYHGQISPPGPLPTVPSWALSSGGNFGISVAALDANADGYEDVVVTDLNMLRAYYGKASGPSTSASWTVSVGGADNVVGAGDVDGDGYDDLLVGAEFIFPTTPGYMLVFRGSSTGFAVAPAQTFAGIQPPGNYGNFFVASAGDVNADGFDDALFRPGPQVAVQVFLGSAAGLVEVSPLVPTSQAWGVSGAGDVDLDGYDDVILSTTSRLYLYRGGSAGIEPTPFWSYPISGASTAGDAVARAGDVNGDGYPDVLAVQGGYARAFLGSATGLGAAPAWSTPAGTDPYVSVSGAGDVNADGYDDVLVSAIDGRGASLFLGSPAGPQYVAAWNTKIDANHDMTAALGADVNGDGRSDVFVAAGIGIGFSYPGYVNGFFARP